MIYFISNGRGLVKIGVSKSPSSRLSQLQTGSSDILTLIREMEGGVEAENYLHRKFADHRVSGEWFIFQDEMMSVVVPNGHLVNQNRTIEDAKDFASFRDLWIRNLCKMDAATVPSGAKIVGVRISMYMHQDKQYAHPAYMTLAQDVGMGERIVQKHTKALEDAGFLFVDRNRNIVNFYFLDAFWVKDEGKIERLTGVSRYDLRPDIYGDAGEDIGLHHAQGRV